MNKRNVYPKVAMDMFSVQGNWTLWFLGILTIIHIIKYVIAINTGSTQEDFFVSSYVSANMYMLVVGIIAAYNLLPFFVKHGISRKDFFKGSILAVIGLSIALTISSLILTGLEHAITNVFNLPMTIDNSTVDFFSSDEGEPIIANIIKMLVVSPFVALDENWGVSVTLTCLHLISTYSIGWLIGAGYYRYGWVAGFGFIGFSIVLMMAWDILWGSELVEPLSTLLGTQSIELPFIASIIGSIIIITLTLWIIRLLTRRVIIKI